MSADLFAAFLADGANESEAFKGSDATIDVKSTSTIPLVTQQNLQPSSQVCELSQVGIPKKEPAPLWRKDGKGTDVLFDAEEPEADDDFGAFETVSDAKAGDSAVDVISQSDLQPLVPDLLADEDFVPQASVIRPRMVRTEDNHAVQVEQQGKGTSPSSWDEDWGDFEQVGAGKQRMSEQRTDQGHPKPRSTQKSIIEISEDDWEPFEDSTSDQKQTSVDSHAIATSPGSAQGVPSQIPRTSPAFERPTNIPPPSSLLQLLSTAFEVLHKDTTDQSKLKPKTELASQLMVTFRTACRIVAGKSLRWKRDTILAQSVRVGQAGKSGGMKLASLNKNESTKEQRDAEEMIHDWSKYVHEFKSILAQARFQPHRLRISASPSIQTLRCSSTGDSSKQCALCGLRRTERLAEVDTDADDIFGEFWTEHWGHKDCYDFWYTHKDLLRHR
ncbi:hypothetical protein A1O3_07547 [Capronia epimyces CBS 606.96]|uniref:PARP-type domain-containing protein n=1 Tax=Capronia epimyces CBS 606.96 TaxID=1182542 RepID=W9XL45_9EURO|nr:uncharacterized protein A1O3_07547 [Capronia epimyces CBS 606.96]EXJ81257.1 hypothetical protein A1O3_07547 [Capronia epimyces CBS 606.96]